VNPYVGCVHGCTYCYARFIKRFTGHREAWGEFVDVKVNAPTLLEREVAKKKPNGRVWIAGLCDAYQPLEKQYKLTRRCLEVLSRHGWPVTVQTKSGLVLRDLDLLRGWRGLEVTFSIATADEGVRRLFEPNAPTLAERFDALEKLYSEGIHTNVMIAPLLPGAERLAEVLRGKVDHVLIDRMNYHHADWVYRNNHLDYALSSEFFVEKKKDLSAAFKREGIPCQPLF